MTIIEFFRIYRTQRNKFCLPAFQRNFSWTNKKKIEDLFDSIFHGYPLPKFFTWSLDFENVNEGEAPPPVALYHFIEIFDQGHFAANRFGEHEYTQHIAICDGQQRLTAFLIGLCGRSFTKREVLFINLLLPAGSTDKRFHMMTEAKARRANQGGNGFYFKVSDLVINYFMRPQSIERIIESFFRENNFIDNIIVDRNLYRFYSVLNSNTLDFEDLQPIIQNDLDKAVEFFQRINNGGVKLSKNEILFALLTRFLTEDQATLIRGDFDNLRRDFRVFAPDNTFLLRVCLYCTGNQVLFKPDNFHRDTIIRIADQWAQIHTAIRSAFTLIRDQMQLDQSISSLNSTIPLIYHLYKKNNQINLNEQREFSKYLIRSQFSGVFGSHNDNVLAHLRERQAQAFDNNPAYSFVFNLFEHNLPPGKSFSVSNNEIEKILNYRYENNAFMIKAILKLIYPNLVAAYDYTIDHMHPASTCENRGILFQVHHLIDGEVDFIQENYDKLPNLQLLPHTCNESKNDRTLSEWVRMVEVPNLDANSRAICFHNAHNAYDYLQHELYPMMDPLQINNYLDISNFQQFFMDRKEMLRVKLVGLLQ